MYIMLNFESVALQKLKSSCFVSKEKLLKSGRVKTNDETWWKAMIEFPLIMEARRKVSVFWGDFLNKNIPRKKKSAA